MPVYRVVRKADQAEVSRYAAGQTWPDEWPLDAYDHIEVPEDGPAPYAGSWHITKLAFRQRFTSTERAAITYAAKAATQTGAAIQSYLDDVQAASYIDLKRLDTRGGVQALEAGGAIAAGRSTVILDTDPTAEELYRG